ncbi:MAG: hypothetical protein AAF493_23040 [Pseudomonadota bacterium]
MNSEFSRREVEIAALGDGRRGPNGLKALTIGLALGCLTAGAVGDEVRVASKEPKAEGYTIKTIVLQHVDRSALNSVNAISQTIAPVKTPWKVYCGPTIGMEAIECGYQVRNIGDGKVSHPANLAVGRLYRRYRARYPH